MDVLREVLKAGGPFASVCFDSSHDSEDGGRETDLRWRAVRERLVELDAPEGTLSALDQAVTDREPPAGRAGRFMIAGGGRVLVDEYLPRPPVAPVSRVSALPYLLPLAETDVPHVVVAVDKTGADLRAVRRDGSALDDHVQGRGHPMRSHRNMQAHTEETVRQNLREVADHVAYLVQRVNAGLIITAGDVEPRTVLYQALPDSCRKIAVRLDVSRSDRVALERAIEKCLDEYWREEHDRVLDRFDAELSRPDGLAVDGLRDTANALREGDVELLVINPGELGERTVWLGSEPRLVATDRGELHAIGASERVESRADEALPAAAVATGARLTTDGTEPGDPGRLDGLADGVGALLRHG